MINSRKLSDLRSDVRANAELWLAECKKQGLTVLVTQTLRDDEYQARLYAQGRTLPGQIVTNSKVTTFHGRGLALDFCKNIPGGGAYLDDAFFKRAADIAKEMGFSWGGDWRSFPDRPHLQWDDHGRWSGSLLRAGLLPPLMPLYRTEENTKPAKEEDDMDLDGFKALWREMRKELQDNDASTYSAEARQWAIDNGIVEGGNSAEFNGMWEDGLTREQAVTLLYRFAKKFGLV